MNIQVSISLPLECVEELRKLARARSVKDSESISTSTLVREAIYKAYEMPQAPAREPGEDQVNP